jgi:hypothetical protein
VPLLYRNEPERHVLPDEPVGAESADLFNLVEGYFLFAAPLQRSLLGSTRFQCNKARAPVASTPEFSCG